MALFTGKPIPNYAKALFIFAVILILYKYVTKNEKYRVANKILYFSQRNCPACQSFKPVWDNFYYNYSNNEYVQLKEVPAESNREMVSLYGVNYFPKVIAVHNDTEIAEMTEFKNSSNLIAFLSKVSSIH